MDTTRLSDREIGMLERVISNKRWFKLHLVGVMLNIPLDIPDLSPFTPLRSERDIQSIFYLYNTSGRFSRTFIGDVFALVCPDEIEMIHGILRNG